MKHKELNFLQRIGLELMWAFAWLFAIMPYWFKYYVVENLLFFLLYYVLRYRMKVVKMNLRNSFPEKSEKQRNEICRKFYFTLAEMFVDTFNLAYMTTAKAKRILQVDADEYIVERTAGQDWIALTAHYGCWEYYAYWGFYDPSKVIMSVYHPLHNEVVNRFYQRLRSVQNSQPVAMREVIRYYLRHREQQQKGKNFAIGLIADQNPPLRPDSHWFQFLNQDTVFFDGGEKLALKFHLPVYFVSVDRLCRGRYRMHFEQIYDGKESVAPNEITGRYVQKLEEMIVAQPELWMWSHRRWKHKRTNVCH